MQIAGSRIDEPTGLSIGHVAGLSRCSAVTLSQRVVSQVIDNIGAGVGKPPFDGRKGGGGIGGIDGVVQRPRIAGIPQANTAVKAIFRSKQAAVIGKDQIFES